MAPRFGWLVLVGYAPLFIGCSGDTTEAAASGDPSGCAPGEWLRDDGVCVSAGLPPDMPCPPGEWLEDGVCIPAGVPPDGCGEGFVHDGDRGCEAILPAEPCPEGLMAVPGETRCREVAPCAPGTWGGIAIEPDTEHVDASYQGGASDGSQAAPWTTIQAGVDAVLAGAIVAVAAGSYAEDVVIEGKPVRLWGTCPALVELAGTGAGFAALNIRAGASGSEVRRLGISGQARGVFLSGSENVVVEETWIHECARRGIGVEDALGPTSVVVRGSLVERNHELGVFVAGSDATVEATVVRDTLPDVQGLLGRGIGVQNDEAASKRGSAVVARSLVERNHELGVFVGGSDATLEATVVRDTLPDVQGLGGRGIGVQNDEAASERGTAGVARSLVERNHEIGVYVQGSDATVEATVVRDTLPSQGRGGRGIGVQDDPATGARGSAVVARSLVERNHEIGVFVGGSDATLEATVVRNTLPDPLGRALQVQRASKTGAAASAMLRASVFERSFEAGIFVIGPATAELEACLVRDTASNEHGFLGDGLVVWSYDGAATATVTATRIEESDRAAVSSFGAAVALGSSLLVCQGFDIGAESWQGQPSVFADQGGVLCGCPEATERCKAQSYALEPPPPIE